MPPKQAGTLVLHPPQISCLCCAPAPHQPCCSEATSTLRSATETCRSSQRFRPETSGTERQGTRFHRGMFVPKATAALGTAEPERVCPAVKTPSPPAALWGRAVLWLPALSALQAPCAGCCGAVTLRLCSGTGAPCSGGKQETRSRRGQAERCLLHLPGPFN